MLDFLGEEGAFGREADPEDLYEDKRVFRTSPDRGMISFQVQQWAAVYPGYGAWFLVDARWPNVELVTPLESA